ncbi:hypothetical protein J6590_068753 [Homalodisca vitripennis]|nr:hypothetical protein J6590_068753 [Homalodisca vitripennis]
MEITHTLTTQLQTAVTIKYTGSVAKATNCNLLDFFKQREPSKDTNVPVIMDFYPTKPLCCHVLSWPYNIWILCPLAVEYLKLTANGTSDWRVIVQRLQTRILVPGKYPHRTFTQDEQWCSGCKLEFRYLVSIHIGPSHRMSNGAAAANWNLGIW